MEQKHIQEIEELIASGRIGTSKIEVLRTLLLDNEEQEREIQRLRIKLEWFDIFNPSMEHER